MSAVERFSRRRFGAFVTAFAVTLVASSSTFSAQAGSADAGKLPTKIPEGTVLRIGDPETQRALELSGLIDKLPFKVEWANISGGPQTIEAFRANALDVGSVADIPPIHATWTGLKVKIIAAKFRKEPVAHPIYQLGIAPGVEVKTLADLRGKRIAFSPGQAQGALVLRVLQAAGLKKEDVTLIELPSKGDAYPVALASKQVDVAPIWGVLVKHYLHQYGADGATTIPHGLRDDPAHLYAPQAVLDDPAKAAALGEYVHYWAPRQQATIDLLARELNKPPIKAEDLFDRRFETIAANALNAS
ncbi:ABC transporter substrate-binding protein [Aminobacter anthyllidis]|uniref:ABC transporter substrate-binding protein n=1 Tax=Aminobacter anthyllidis TaxID=1035067 RepID=A0A9X1D722_9HYPH|nr:ABC transporter substrate-binding protein [Aminobacter anthyllidis]MBT1159510.1 ABC transporter substrate-binding protein [Aminobacter anthyllidis]